MTLSIGNIRQGALLLRILAVSIAVTLVPSLAGADELKPKFGNIDGVYYTDVAGDREPVTRRCGTRSRCAEKTPAS